MEVIAILVAGTFLQFCLNHRQFSIVYTVIHPWCIWMGSVLTKTVPQTMLQKHYRNLPSSFLYRMSIVVASPCLCHRFLVPSLSKSSASALIDRTATWKALATAWLAAPDRINSWRVTARPKTKKSTDSKRMNANEYKINIFRTPKCFLVVTQRYFRVNKTIKPVSRLGERHFVVSRSGSPRPKNVGVFGCFWTHLQVHLRGKLIHSAHSSICFIQSCLGQHALDASSTANSPWRLS